MNEDKRTRLISLGVTLLLHLVVVLLLLWITLPHVEAEEESGVLLMVGLVDESTGLELPEGAPMQQPEADAAEESTAEATPTAATPVPTPTPSASEEPMIAQHDESAPAIASDAKKKKEETKSKQPTPEELQRQAEAKRQAEEARLKAEAEAKRKAEEESKRKAASSLAAGAFGKSGQGGTAANAGTGVTGAGAQGTPNGNSSTGASNGTPGWGSYDLGGRGLRGGLPKPTFNVNASGTVVVSITVDASGSVTAATVSPRGTTTSDASLRGAAVKAAQNAKFEAKSDATVQYGTITYRFDSDN